MMIKNIQPTKLAPVNNHPKINASLIGQKDFSKMLKASIEKVNQSQLEAEKVTQKLVNGEQIDLHNVMITSQKALITLQTTVEVRNKVIEAYQEVMRMQV